MPWCTVLVARCSPRSVRIRIQAGAPRIKGGDGEGGLGLIGGREGFGE